MALVCICFRGTVVNFHIVYFSLFLINAASELLKFVLEKAKMDPTITEVYLHVQVGNDEAKKFYLAHGFEEVGIIKDYYKRIDPPDCFILKKSLKDV